MGVLARVAGNDTQCDGSLIPEGYIVVIFVFGFLMVLGGYFMHTYFR